MNPGDLVKIKDSCAYGGAFMQQIAGREGLVLSFQDIAFNKSIRCFVLICGKKYFVWTRDMEKIQ